MKAFMTSESGEFSRIRVRMEFRFSYQRLIGRKIAVRRVRYYLLRRCQQCQPSRVIVSNPALCFLFLIFHHVVLFPLVSIEVDDGV